MFAVWVLLSAIVQFAFSIDIPHITKKDHKQLASETPSLILYYLDGDEDSMKLKNTLSDALFDLTQYGLTLGQVNCVTDTEVCEKVNLESLPELRLRVFALSYILTHFFDCLLVNSLERNVPTPIKVHLKTVVQLYLGLTIVSFENHEYSEIALI